MVVSTKGLKTCIVAVKRRVFHKRYGKVLTVTKRLAVHDPYQKAQLGQKVEICSTRPISKRKRWCLI
jgi:small subunit ribosomal protein S17